MIDVMNGSRIATTLLVTARFLFGLLDELAGQHTTGHQQDARAQRKQRGQVSPGLRQLPLLLWRGLGVGLSLGLGLRGLDLGLGSRGRRGSRLGRGCRGRSWGRGWGELRRRSSLLLPGLAGGCSRGLVDLLLALRRRVGAHIYRGVTLDLGVVGVRVALDDVGLVL
jgi:hypothetical protein